MHGVRALLRTPGVTALAVVSLALGANSAAFSVLNALVLRTIAPGRNERNHPLPR